MLAITMPPPAAADVLRDCTEACPEMVIVGPGTFPMGPADGEAEREDPDEVKFHQAWPRHQVTIRYKFAIGKYDVTRGEFATFVNQTGYQSASDCVGYDFATGTRLPMNRSWQNPGFAQTDRDPVVCINMDDIRAFIAWLNTKTHQHYRLPSEAEWEFAARAGTTTAHYWGDDNLRACQFANVHDLAHEASRHAKPNRAYFECNDGFAYTSPVGSFEPNGWGLYDMLGNVDQVTRDCWSLTYEGAPADGSAWRTKPPPQPLDPKSSPQQIHDYILRANIDCMVQPTRGSSFLAVPATLRSAYRGYGMPGFIRDRLTGFRLVRDLTS